MLNETKNYDMVLEFMLSPLFIFSQKQQIIGKFLQPENIVDHTLYEICEFR